MTTLRVELGDRSYPIHCQPDLADVIRQETERLRAGGRPVAVITDRNVAAAQAGFFQRAWPDLPRLVLPPGESTKSLRQFGRVCDFLARHRIDRSGALFAVGGGVIGDLTGFAAAAYLRGLDFYQVPTSLLAMVDSSVGGKTGINIKAGKNLVGAFWQPRAVYCSLDSLRTLPPREFSAGMAEAIKTALLADAALFAQLDEPHPPLRPDGPDLAAVILRCCAVKSAVVGDDERELHSSGGRALLNLGHTFGHAIEAVAGYGAYLHGEAVAIGLRLAADLSVKLGLLDALSSHRVRRVLQRHDLPIALRQPLPIEPLLSAMARDKKVRAGRLRFVILQSPGSAATAENVDPTIIRQLWQEAETA